MLFIYFFQLRVGLFQLLVLHHDIVQLRLRILQLVEPLEQIGINCLLELVRTFEHSDEPLSVGTQVCALLQLAHRD